MNTKLTSKCWAIVPASGVGSRMQSTTPKQYLSVNGCPLIEHSLQQLLSTDWIAGIVVAIAGDDTYWHDLQISTVPGIETVTGGVERLDSVWNALQSIQNKVNDDDFILVHDAARPCLGKADLNLLYQGLYCHSDAAKSGLLLADKITDTVKRDDGHSSVLMTVPRQGLWRALTPQVFPNAILVKALQKARDELSDNITDEASAVEAIGLSPKLIQGRNDNIKVTNAGDIEMASLILKLLKEQQQCA